MRLFERYIHAELLRAYVVVNLMLLGLFGFFDLSVQLDDVGEGNYSTLDALLFTFKQLPQRLVELTPFSALLSVVTALGLMATRHELVVLRGAGLSPMRIAASVLKAGIVLLVMVLWLQSFVAPPLQQQAQQMRASAIAGGGIADDASFWLRSRSGTVHIGGLENARVPVNIEIFEFGDNAVLSRYLHAARAQIPASGPWLLHDVVVKRFGASGDSTTHRDTLAWAPTLYARQLAVLDLPPESLSPLSLYRYTQYLQSQKQDAQRFRIALWQKLALPLTTIAMILLAMPLVFVNPRGANLGLRIAIAAGIGLLAYALAQAVGNLAFLFGLSAPLCMLTPGALLCLLALLWLRRVG